jgi:hypothetical protein
MFDTSYCTNCGNKLERVRDVAQVSPLGEVPILNKNVWLMHRWCAEEFREAARPGEWRIVNFPARRLAVQR